MVQVAKSAFRHSIKSNYLYSRSHRTMLPTISHRKQKIQRSHNRSATAEGASLVAVPVESSTAHSLNASLPQFLSSNSSAVVVKDESNKMPIVKETLKLALELAEKAVDGLPIPGIQGALGGLLTIIKNVEVSQSNTKTLEALSKHLDAIRDQVIGPVLGFREFEISDIRKDAIKRLFELGKLANEWGNRSARGHLQRWITASADQEKLLELEKSINQAIQEFNMSAQGAIWAAHEQSEYSRLLDSLPRVHEASHDSGHFDGPTECLKGTRVEVLKTLEEWIHDTFTNGPRVFWLNGLAGIGKSTIARTIAARTKKRGILGGSFFFSREEKAQSRADQVIPTLAFRLAQLHPVFFKAIGEALKKDPDCGYKGLQVQFDKLIVSPLIAAAPSIPSESIVLLVLDALDECASEPQAAELLRRFLERANNVPFQFRILITSRPEHHIRRVFNGAAGTDYFKYSLHDIEASIVRRDIERYLEYHLKQIPSMLDLSMERDWPRAEDMSILVDKCGKLFVYAATAIQFIQGDRARNPQARMDILLETRKAINAKPYAQLDQLYYGILSYALPSNSEPEDYERFRWLISCIVLLRGPLTLSALHRFLECTEEDVTNTLYHLHSIILAPSGRDQAPHIYHPSFHDFITDPERCTDSRFTVDVPLQERQIVLRCFRLMMEHLTRDVVNVSDSSHLSSDLEVRKKIRTRFFPEVQYACRFWCSHLLKVSRGDRRVIKELRKFTFSYLLCWFEAMSLLQAIRTVGSAMKDVYRWAMESQCDRDLIRLLHDGYRFILASSQPISENALQVYKTALPFTPHNTLLFETYERELTNNVRVLRGTCQSWSSCLSVRSTLGHGRPCLDISPDGSHIVIGTCKSDTIGLWDMSSATLIQTIKHDKEISSLAFSLSGVQICIAEASLYLPAIVIRDMIAEVRIHTLIGHQNFINTISMSTVKAHLASASSDATVKVWDVDAGECIATLQADSQQVWAAVFVPNVSKIIAGSQDGMIRLWDVDLKTILMTFNGGSQHILCIDVSRDGRYMASGSRDKTIRLFNLASRTHEPIHTMKDHIYDVNSLHFHPVDSRLISGSDDSVVALWDWDSNHRALFRVHLSFVTAVRYTPDGRCAVTASHDLTWRMWDISVPYTAESDSDAHTGWVRSAKFSEDGSLLATGSDDCTVKVWNTSSGQIVHTFRGHAHSIRSLAFSRDGVMLASGSSDETVRLWNIEAGGECIAILPGHNDVVLVITFTDDDHLMAQTKNETINWNLADLGSGPPKRWTAQYADPSHAMRDRSEGYTVEMVDGHCLLLRKGQSMKRLTRIPEDYPVDDLLFSKDTVAITCKDGRVLIIDISQAKKGFL